MKKIEQQIVRAISGRQSFDPKNDRDLVDFDADRGQAKVYLHGNLIAIVDPMNLRVHFTLAGWPTFTTKSRLNALLSVFVPHGGHIYQSNHIQYADIAGKTFELGPDDSIDTRAVSGGQLSREYCRLSNGHIEGE